MRVLYAALVRWEARVAGAFLVLMVALIFLGGVARMAGHPQNWTTDTATCLFAWACFLCADIAWRGDNLMAVEILTARLSPGAQKACRILNHLLIAAFLVYVIGMGSWLAWTSRIRSFQGIPEISYSWITASMPFGAALLLITAALKIRGELRGDAASGRSAADVL